MKRVVKHQYLQIFVDFGLKLNKLNKNMSNFHPLEFVGRGSETQLQVGANINCLI